MNKPRRTALKKIAGKFRELCEELQALKKEEEEYRDNMPENLQASEKYEKADEAISGLEDVLSSVEDAVDEIETAIAV